MAYKSPREYPEIINMTPVSKAKKHRETKIGMNVARSGSKSGDN